MNNSIELTSLLKSKLTYDQFVKLSEALSISQHRKTKILDRPETMEYKEILLLSQLLNTTPQELFDNYSCGKDQLTATDYRLLISPAALNHNL